MLILATNKQIKLIATYMFNDQYIAISHNKHILQARSQKILLGVLLKEMWPFSYCSHSTNHSPGTVDELIFYGVCIAYIYDGL